MASSTLKTNGNTCSKYDVWSCTPLGNKKLDAAFSDVEAKASEKSSKYQIILVLSVNESGQFLAVAEMIGRVDFDKDMDFWRLDMRNGFFPENWPAIYDINASDLFIPFMALGTYVVLAGFFLGINGK